MGIERKEAVPGSGARECVSASRLANGVRLVYGGGAVEFRRKENGAVVAEWPGGGSVTVIAEGDGFGADRFMAEMEREAFGRSGVGETVAKIASVVAVLVASGALAAVLYVRAPEFGGETGPDYDGERAKPTVPEKSGASNRALDDLLSGSGPEAPSRAGGSGRDAARDAPPNPDALDPEEIPLPGEADRGVKAETAPDAPEDVADKTDAAERPSVDDVISEMDAMRKEMDAEATGSGAGGSGGETPPKSGRNGGNAGSIALPGGGDIDSPEDLREFGLEP